MKNKKLSYIFVILTAIIWGSSPAVSKILLSDLDFFNILFYYFLVATISLFILSIFKNKLQVIKTYKIKDYGYFILLALLGVFLYDILLFQGYLKASVQEAYIVNYTYPIWTVIFAIFILKEKFDYGKLIAVLFGFFGVYFIVTKGSISSFDITNIEGFIYALLAAMFYGLFSILARKKDYEIFTSMFFYHLISTILVFITTIFYSSFVLPSFNEFLLILYVGIFVNGLAYVLWFLALKHGDIHEVSNIIFLAPFLSLVFLYLFTGDKILMSSFLGLIFIVIGIVIQRKLSTKKL